LGVEFKKLYLLTVSFFTLSGVIKVKTKSLLIF